MSDPTLTAKAVFDTNAALASINAFSREVQNLGRSMRQDVAAPAREASQHAASLTDFIRDQRREMRFQVQTAGLLSKEYGGIAKAVGLSSQSLASFGTVLGAFAMGGVAGAAIEGVKLLAEWLNKSSEEAAKLKEIRVKFQTQGEQRIFDSLTKLNAERMRAEGRSEKEIRAYEAVRGNEAAVLEIRKEQAPIMERLSALTAKRAALEASMLGKTPEQVLNTKNAIAAYQGKIDELTKSYDELQGVIDQSMESAKKAGAIEGQAADEQKAREKALQQQRKDGQAEREAALQAWQSHVRHAYAEEERLMAAINKRISDRDKEEKKAADEAFEGRVSAARKEIKEQEEAAEEAARMAIQIGSSAASALGSALGGVVTGTKSVAEAFTAMGVSVIDTIIDIATKSIAASAVKAAGEAASSQAGVPIIGPILAAAAMVSMGAMVRGLLGGLPGRAYGGQVSAGSTYWVGERGRAELFTPNVSGSITPIEKLGGAGNVTVNVNPTAVDHHGMRRLFRDNRATLMREIGKAVRDGVMR